MTAETSRPLTPDASEAPSTLPSTPPLQGRLKDLLADNHLVLTGVTGFIGEQLLWKILTELPTTTTHVLVRPKAEQTAEDRVAELLAKPIFADVVQAAGSIEALLGDRVRVLSGDLPDVPALPPELDVVIHCAGDVSFDPPVDHAFRTNVLGTKALMRAMRDAVSDDSGNLVKVPHYLHVSTAFTAGRRRGPIPESSHPHEVDYQHETEAALQLAEATEDRSRSSEVLVELRRRAQRDYRRAGFLTTAAETERLRQEWVNDELVTAGTERARSLGWTDAYTFAKAMAERAVEELGADIRVSVVRPAIVESSLKHPFPGWIEGFKMAEPIILAYGKGQLPEFPASPDAAIDIVPCDHVVNAIIAVAATTPEIGEPEYYHVASGARNRLTYRGVYGHVQAYYREHPLRPNVKLPTWKFPGATPVERALNVGERLQKIGLTALRVAPRTRQSLGLGLKLTKQGRQLGFLRRYLDLYGEYLRAELHFLDDRMLALHRNLHPEDVESFGFDTASFDWAHYMQEVHIPAISAPVQERDAARRHAGKPSTWVELADAPAAGQAPVLAIFDLDGTVLRTNVIETYLWSKLPDLSLLGKMRELADLTVRLPLLLDTERRDRGDFLRAVYRRYAGTDMAELEAYVDEQMAPHILGRLAPEAEQRIKEHRDAGHVTVLLTGAISVLTRPLAPLFDVISAAELEVDEDGIATGFLSQPALVGESRVAWLQQLAQQRGADLAESSAYADAMVDLPLLEAVGHPVAVNPDLDLFLAAQDRGWTTQEWHAGSRIPAWRMPAKPRASLLRRKPAYR
ncbi:HAD-IB family hydrolase [Parenemella sanctibonifatiensis]|uniref:HAD-IB family hydrolase n=1 Tax=Parenemella sanctibonifatiensis TaxID=2016505 RepID=UPI001E30CDE2|nr:HAD-IB family hydrolase [Parenemella sanctibonifatiensis]